ncbi:hypothetical protein [Hymenobacter profundi]|uniref:Uncharacterized protein n=1 Tax=Hymenobacter profundi TaxID=1982110 RepID=A0ABS6X2D9_9BACT|nr:hypothetical protein [Hymenobacter profundi]MBW3129895.1 hypothetical protein [Hymenobacter profundi]
MSARFLFSFLSASLLLGSSACTISQEQGVEVARPAVPAEILTDADRQAAYNSNAGFGSGTAPDATPGRVQPGQSASDVNSRKRPESLNTNLPNNTPTETRLSRLRGAPVDTLRLPR